MYLEKNCKLYKFATANSNFFKKLTLSNMHHRKTYMYINLQQNRVGRSVKTYIQIYLRKNRKFHKFASTILKKVCAYL